MKLRIIILWATILIGQSAWAQEHAGGGSSLDTKPASGKAPLPATPAVPWDMPHSQLPYTTFGNATYPYTPPLLHDSILAHGAHDPLQAVAPLPPTGSYDQQAMLTVGGWNVVGAGGTTSFPGMMETGAGYIGLHRSLGNLTFYAGMNANRYHANIMDNPTLVDQGIHTVSTQYGVRGALSLQLNPYWSLTAFGQYFNHNPYFFMAALPFVQTSSYGTYATYTNGKFGMDMGVRRYYDAFGRKWITEPIVTPKFKLGRKVWMELPVGGLIRQGTESIVHPRRQGPLIMPTAR